MKQYLMIFGHSPYGAHQFRIAADSNEDAIKQALARLNNSPMVSLTYELFEIAATISDYQTWERGK